MPTRSLRPFLIWLAIFYPTWLLIVQLGGHWREVFDHWAIAVAMALGSYVAGSTPMGGGTVGFPILVLLFDQPASLGRDFGLAIQSIGMVSASIYILSRKRPLDWHLLRPALLGALIGTPLSCALIAPIVPGLGAKLLFAVVWASFGLLHFAKLRTLISAQGRGEPWGRADLWAGLAIGIAGGIVASLIGVGANVLIYAVLVLAYRADLKVAVPTSVILMAFTSVLGICTNLLLSVTMPARHSVDIEVFYNWLAAAPVVAIGAPIGALVVNIIPRVPTLLFVSALCVGQFIWTVVKEGVTGVDFATALAGVAAMCLVFWGLFAIGARRAAADHNTA
jgi:uncharacterized membrane protein YfcA